MDNYIQKFQPTFVIIGTGVSGLTSARYCLKNNYNIIILEKNKDIGGVWLSKSYDGIALQTTKDSYAYSDFPHFQKTSLYPTGQEVLTYLKEYAAKHNILKYTKFNCSVEKVKFDYPSEFWEIEYINSINNTKESVKANYLLICSGFYTDSLKNPFKSGYSNNNKIINPNRFSKIGDLKLDIVTDKNIVIIGNGPTGCDLATLALKYKPKSLKILFRTKRWLFRRYLWNKVSTHFFLSRFGLNIAQKTKKNIYILIVTIIYYILYLFCHNIWKISGISPPFETVNRKNLVLNENILSEIYKKNIDYIQAFDIDISEDYITFMERNKKNSKKKSIEYDLCIMATGYESNIKYMDYDKIPYLYKNIIDPNTPNCGFIGFAASFNWVQLSELQIQWYLEYLKQNIKQISTQEMIEDINNHISNKNKIEYDYHDLAITSYQYCDNLAKDINIKLKYNKYNYKYWFNIPEHDLWSSNNK